jgi:hypothetical protein
MNSSLFIRVHRRSSPAEIVFFSVKIEFRLFRRTTAALFDSRRKNRRRRPGADPKRFPAAYLVRISWPVVLRAVRTYRRAYLAASNADGPEAEMFDRLDGPTHSNTPRLL